MVVALKGRGWPTPWCAEWGEEIDMGEGHRVRYLVSHNDFFKIVTLLSHKVEHGDTSLYNIKFTFLSCTFIAPILCQGRLQGATPCPIQ